MPQSDDKNSGYKANVHDENVDTVSDSLKAISNASQFWRQTIAPIHDSAKKNELEYNLSNYIAIRERSPIENYGKSPQSLHLCIELKRSNYEKMGREGSKSPGLQEKAASSVHCFLVSCGTPIISCTTQSQVSLAAQDNHIAALVNWVYWPMLTCNLQGRRTGQSH